MENCGLDLCFFPQMKRVKKYTNLLFHIWVINFNNYLYGLVHILFVFSKIEKQLTKCLIGTLTNTEYISENPREIYVAQLAMAAFSSVCRIIFPFVIQMTEPQNHKLLLQRRSHTHWDQLNIFSPI